MFNLSLILLIVTNHHLKNIVIFSIKLDGVNPDLNSHRHSFTTLVIPSYLKITPKSLISGLLISLPIWRTWIQTATQELLLATIVVLFQNIHEITVSEINFGA